MSGKPPAKRFPGHVPATKPPPSRGIFDIRGVQDEATKIAPPQVGDGLREYSPKASIPNYTHSDEPIRRATMLENGSGMSGTVNTKFCILILILSVVLLSALTITVLVVGRHPTHSNMKPGGMSQAGVIASGANELVFDLTEGGPMRRELIRYYYDIILGDEVQQWQRFPKNNDVLPINSSLHKISSYDVCCFSDQNEWICAMGHTFDAYAFEARLKSVAESIGGVQCLIYINSRHLARSQCTVEILMRS